MLGDTRLKLWPVRPCPPDAGRRRPRAARRPVPSRPGAVGRAGGVFAGTATRPVELGDVQPPGKRRMTAAEWARGLHLTRPGRASRPWSSADHGARARGRAGARSGGAACRAADKPAHRQPVKPPPAPSSPGAAPGRARARRAAGGRRAAGRHRAAQRPGPAGGLRGPARGARSATRTRTCSCPALLRERGLTGRDAAFATELSYGTLRGQGTYDAVIAACSARGLDQIDPPVRDVLRLGAHQLLATRVGAHAAVATSVDLAREVSGPGAAGFVNAVLRRVAARDLEAWIAATAPQPGRRPLATWRSATATRAGSSPPSAPSLAEDARHAGSTARPRPRWPRRRPGRRWPCARCPGSPARQNWSAAGAEPARWSPFGAYLESGDPAAVAAVGQGRAAVQDEASQLAALALARVDVGAPGPAAGSTCAPGRAARHGCSPGWRPQRRPAARRRRPPAPGAAGAERPSAAAAGVIGGRRHGARRGGPGRSTA